MSTSKIIKAYITDLNGNRVTGAYVSDTVTALTYDGQTYTRNAQTGRSFAIAKDGDDFVAYLYNPDEAVSDGLVATFEGDLQYSLTPAAQTAYLNAPNNTQSLPMVGDGVVYTYILFNESGNWLSTSNDYTLVGYHASVDGPLLSFEGTGVYLFKDTTYGRMKITSNGAMRVSIQRIEYTVS